MARNPKIGFYNLDKLLFEHRRHEMQGTGLGRIKASYVEISGFLFTEFLLTHSPKYLFGSLSYIPGYAERECLAQVALWKDSLMYRRVE